MNLGGDVLSTEIINPSGSLTVACSGNAYSFTIEKSTDGSYSLVIEHENPTTGATSNPVLLTWIRDTDGPAEPVILNPPTASYTAGGNLNVSGTCEPFATVTLSGDDSQQVACSSRGIFGFTVIKNVDRTYQFTLMQTDLAGNESGMVSLTWTRDSSVLPAPTITAPALNPLVSNAATLILSGACVSGYAVHVGGDVAPADMVVPPWSTSTDCVDSVYTFEIGKAAEGTYQFTVSQTDGVTFSPVVAQYWTRDTTVPVVSITSQPPNPNLVLTSSVTFAASESVRFECRLDSGAWSTCSSPYQLANLANGQRTLEIRGTDPAGNVSAIVSVGWTQAANKTVALYRMNDGSHMTDSSLNTGTLNNAFVTDSGVGTAASASGAFGQARSFANHVLAAPDSETFGTIRGTLTAEAWVKLTSNSFSGSVVIMGQHAPSPNMGWELRIKKQGSNLRVAAVFSFNGTTIKEISSTNQALLNEWKHIAVTFNSGSVRIYLNGAQIASGTVGTAGTSQIFNTATDFRVGRGASGNGITGLIDEVRVSQVLRYNAPFTSAVPTGPFTAD